MKIFSFAISLIFMMACSVTVYANPPPYLVREWRKVVKVYVETKSGSGTLSASGFPIDKSTFMTAGHFCAAAMEGAVAGVLKESVSVRYMNINDEIATLNGGEIIKFEFTPIQDLCLISLPKHGIRPVRLTIRDAKFGDKVYIVGAPQGVFPIVTEGYVGQPVTQDLPDMLNDKLLVSAPGTNGNSGGPVFNQKGEVIGVAVMVHPTYSHIALAIHATSIWRFLLE